jgi:ATP adenylyltransferase
MKRLWSPWRMSYIQDIHKELDCVFCLREDVSNDEENHIIYRGKFSYVILNRYPYTSGHLMVVPYKHKTSLDSFTDETRSELVELVSQCIQILREVYCAQGFNVGANIGSAAGAGIPKHFHFHVVPRWDGDTNFMSSIGETRVVPEALDDTYHRIKEAWNDLDM